MIDEVKFDAQVKAAFRQWILVGMRREKLSYRKLAELSGLPYSNIHHIVTGTRMPTIWTLTRLGRVLGMNGLATALVRAAEGESKTHLSESLELWDSRLQAFGDDVSPRELEIIREAAIGSTHAATGANLLISEQTVKNHVSSVLKKTNAQNITHAVALFDDLRPGWREKLKDPRLQPKKKIRKDHR